MATVTRYKNRKDSITCHWLSNGDLRFYRDDVRKGGVPELVTNHMKNIASTLICGNINNVIIEYEI